VFHDAFAKRLSQPPKTIILKLGRVPCDIDKLKGTLGFLGCFEGNLVATLTGHSGRGRFTVTSRTLYINIL
jgi:hypothetical protein